MHDSQSMTRKWRSLDAQKRWEIYEKVLRKNVLTHKFSSISKLGKDLPMLHFVGQKSSIFLKKNCNQEETKNEK